MFKVHDLVCIRKVHNSFFFNFFFNSLILLNFYDSKKIIKNKVDNGDLLFL